MIYRFLDMQQERQAKLLRKQIDILLTHISGGADLYDIAKESVNKARQGLVYGDVQTKPWSLLPIIVCDSIAGYYEHTLPAAAALHFMNTAAEVFDDIEDADSSHSLSARYGTAIATNVATTLLILAEKAIMQLKATGVRDDVTIRIVDAINSFYTTTCVGQHLDLSLLPTEATSEETYLKIAGMKSASTIQCACHIGAILADADTSVVHLLTQFGYNLGMAAQIANDIQGITRGSDIIGRKVSLPIIYALNQTEIDSYNLLKDIFITKSESEFNITQIKNLLFNIGAVHYAMIKTEIYKQKAAEFLSSIEKTGANTEHLKLFLK